MNMNVNVDELRSLVHNTRDRNIFIRFLVFCTVTKALAPTFLRYPIDTIKMYVKYLAASGQKNKSQA